jgi:hypothetical protein
VESAYKPLALAMGCLTTLSYHERLLYDEPDQRRPRPIGDRPAAGDADRAAAEPGRMVDLPIHLRAL